MSCYNHNAKPGESDFIQVAFSNLGKNSSLSHLYDVSPPRLPIELPKVITVMIVMVIVMVIVPRILLKIITITNNHYLGSSKSPALRLWGSDGSFAHSSAFHESSPFRKVSQLGFSCFRKCISFATILHDLFSSFRKVLSSHLIAQICNFISFLLPRLFSSVKCSVTLRSCNLSKLISLVLSKRIWAWNDFRCLSSQP